MSARTADAASKTGFLRGLRWSCWSALGVECVGWFQSIKIDVGGALACWRPVAEVFGVVFAVLRVVALAVDRVVVAVALAERNG